MSDPDHRITPDRYDAVLFDLDGVLTRTAEIHALAWQEMFDDFLAERARAAGTEPEPFNAPSDYDHYLDGKPRYDGVRDFLASRGITLDEGSPSDDPQADTVCGLGNRKQQRFEKLLEQRGVTVYEGSVTLLDAVRAAGISTAVVSSSKNCLQVITAAGIADRFDARVDGHDVEDGGLAGKPAPDTYLHAAELLGAEPSRAVVCEDALSGVEAGRNGNFGLVVGVDRANQAKALSEHGADVVVTDLAVLAP